MTVYTETGSEYSETILSKYLKQHTTDPASKQLSDLVRIKPENIAKHLAAKEPRFPSIVGARLILELLQKKS